MNYQYNLYSIVIHLVNASFLLLEMFKIRHFPENVKNCFVVIRIRGLNYDYG